MLNARPSILSLRLIRAFVESANNPEERKAPADLRTFLELGLLAYKNLNEAFESWRDRVIIGAEQPVEAISGDYRQHFEEWADAFASAETEIRGCAWDGQEGDGIRLLCEVRSAQKQVAALLGDWLTPTLATNPGFRRKVISAAEAAKIDQLIDSGCARLKIEPKRFDSNPR